MKRKYPAGPKARRPAHDFRQYSVSWDRQCQAPESFLFAGDMRSQTLSYSFALAALMVCGIWEWSFPHHGTVLTVWGHLKNSHQVNTNSLLRLPFFIAWMGRPIKFRSISCLIASILAWTYRNPWISIYLLIASMWNYYRIIERRTSTPSMHRDFWTSIFITGLKVLVSCYHLSSKQVTYYTTVLYVPTGHQLLLSCSANFSIRSLDTQG